MMTSLVLLQKSFSMMRYVHDHYVDDYEWFLRLDDDAYVNIERLTSILRRIDSSKPRYIGSPGFGRDNNDYIEDEMVYCMGGPGMIFSRKTLKLLSPNLGECLRNGLMTEHEDIELARCIRHHVGIGCTKSYQMSQLFHNNYDINETDTVGLRQVFETVAMRAATYHANKIQKNQYQLHKQVLESKIHALMNYGTYNIRFLY